MKTGTGKKVLISGASIAGLSGAFQMNKSGYQVTVVEIADRPRTTGAAVDIKGAAVDAAKRMGIYEKLLPHRLTVAKVEFKNTDNVTAGAIVLQDEDAEHDGDDIEIERDKFMGVLYREMKDEVEFIFNNRITALHEIEDGITATFKDGSQRAFDLVLGCDGIHSGVRKLWFGDESDYSYFLQAYCSVTIADKLLVKQKTMQMYNEPDKGIMLNAYNGKTDIIFCFVSETQIPYDYRDVEQQRNIIAQQFAGVGWRTAELLDEIQRADNFYFGEFSQIKMPSWAKGRVALIGDAGYCASPAAGMGASLSMIGAMTLAEALQKHDGNYEAAFAEYYKNLRPFIEDVQAMAEQNVRDNFIPRTEEAIRARNAQTEAF